MEKESKLIKEARSTVALVTSYTKESDWAHRYPLMYEIFQERAHKLNAALGESKWDWSDAIEEEAKG